MLPRTLLAITVVSVLCVSLAADGQDLAGYWKSVDFVRNEEDFDAGRKSWAGDLFLKDFQCSANGRTSLGWTCVDGWTIHSDGKTQYRYFLKQMDGDEYLFLPWLSGEVTERGQTPFYYVLRKTEGEITQTKERYTAQRRGSLQDIRPIDRVDPYDDVRWRDMNLIDFSNSPSHPATLRFNAKTIWPEGPRLPEGFDPAQLMEAARNPGLGIRRLHQQGLTGAGVNVAIIDQPLYRDHPEFAGKIVAYHDVGCGTSSSMHGPAVASLLVGSSCGTAPDARVFYVAAPSWTRDASYQAEALDWIVEQNAELPEDAKIRVVSVSAAPSGPGSPFDKNTEQWDEAWTRAEEAGILVLDCTRHHGVIGSCWLDAADPENVSRCTPGFPGRPAGSMPERVLVPTSPRTTAEQYDQGDYSYQYCGRGGLSWAIPYSAGVLAMGWQKRPDIGHEQMLDLLFESAYRHETGAMMINPEAFVKAVTRAKVPPEGVQYQAKYSRKEVYPATPRYASGSSLSGIRVYGRVLSEKS